MKRPIGNQRLPRKPAQVKVKTPSGTGEVTRPVNKSPRAIAKSNKTK